MKRRTLLGSMLAAGVAPFAFTRSYAATSLIGQRVIVVGGGFAGCLLARELKRLLPDVEIVLIEPQASFFSAPSTLDCLFGRKSFQAASRSYTPLIRQGIKFIQGRALSADLKRRVIDTSQGAFAYTALAIASGIDLVPDLIDGLKADPKANLSPYDRATLPELSKRLRGFEGGTIVACAPPGAVKCSPAPYEYALLLAHHLKTRQVNGKVVLIDDRPNPQPQVLAEGFATAIEAMGPLIEYVAQETIVRVDAKARYVETGMGDKIAYDLLSLIPPNHGSALVTKLGIAGKNDSFADVDPLSLQSLAHADVFALGDCSRTPYGFSAGAATQSAYVCARGIAGHLGVKQPEITADNPVRVQTTCYPYLSPETAMRTISRYALHLDKGEMNLHSDPDVEAMGTPENRAARGAWEEGLLATIFGS
jgi:NADPH-dependent 2,4-dienoyl-CoA reductase/sulfur reductase-like enzyme